MASDEPSDGTTALHLVARVRPLLANESMSPREALSMQDGGIVWAKKGATKALNVDAVLGETATQTEVFQAVQDHVRHFVKGYDSAILAYGHTGSGRTFTMGGDRVALGKITMDDVSVDDGSGIIPRSIERIFEACENELVQSPDDVVELSCSYWEVANEKIYDLLATPPAPSPVRPPTDAAPSSSSPPKASSSPKRALQDTLRSTWNSNRPARESLGLPLRQHPLGHVFVQGLTRCDVACGQDALELFYKGCVNRTANSSNDGPIGHTIFEVILSRQSSAGTRVSRLILADLAGVEKPGRGGANNKSLAALTYCMQMLSKSQRSPGSVTCIPFRESVLTRLLQPFLQGTSRSGFVLTLSPAEEALDDTCTTLRFAERLRSIRCTPTRQPLVPSATSPPIEQLHAMQLEMNRLRDALTRVTCKHEAALLQDKALLRENVQLRVHLQASQTLLERSKQVTCPTPSGQTNLATGCGDGADVENGPSTTKTTKKPTKEPVKDVQEAAVGCVPTSSIESPKHEGVVEKALTTLPPLLSPSKDATTRAPEMCLPPSMMKKLVQVPLPMRLQESRRPAPPSTKSTRAPPDPTPSPPKPLQEAPRHSNNASTAPPSDVSGEANAPRSITSTSPLPPIDVKQPSRPPEAPARRHSRRRNVKKISRGDDGGAAVALMSTPRVLALPKLPKQVAPSSFQPPSPKEDSPAIAQYKLRRRAELEEMLGGDFLGNRDAYIFF